MKKNVVYLEFFAWTILIILIASAVFYFIMQRLLIDFDATGTVLQAIMGSGIAFAGSIVAIKLASAAILLQRDQKKLSEKQDSQHEKQIEREQIVNNFNFFVSICPNLGSGMSTYSKLLNTSDYLYRKILKIKDESIMVIKYEAFEKNNRELSEKLCPYSYSKAEEIKIIISGMISKINECLAKIDQVDEINNPIEISFINYTGKEKEILFTEFDASINSFVNVNYSLSDFDEIGSQFSKFEKHLTYLHGLDNLELIKTINEYIQFSHNAVTNNNIDEKKRERVRALGFISLFISGGICAITFLTSFYLNTPNGNDISDFLTKKIGSRMPDEILTLLKNTDYKLDNFKQSDMELMNDYMKLIP